MHQEIHEDVIRTTSKDDAPRRHTMSTHHEYTSLSFALSDQHSGLDDRARPALRRPATLDDIPDAELDRFVARVRLDLDAERLADRPAGQRVSRNNPEWRREFQETLPACARRTSPAPVLRSPVTGARETGGRPPWAGCASDCGAWSAFDARLRAQSHRAGPPLGRGPSRVLRPGTELEHTRAPMNYTWVKCGRGHLPLAHGRDPTSAAGPTRFNSTTATPRRKTP